MKNPFSLIILTIAISCATPNKNAIESIETESENVAENPVKRRFAEREANALKLEYNGIFSNNEESLNLFPIRSTGVSTKPIFIASQKLIASLDDDQLERTIFELDAHEWRKWSNVDNGIYERQGVSLKQMNAVQKQNAFDLMQE